MLRAVSKQILVGDMHRLEELSGIPYSTNEVLFKPIMFLLGVTG